MLLSAFSDISVTAWTMAATAAFLMGVSKAGLKGMSIFNVTLMALAFGSRASTGLFIPLLIVGDVFAVVYYNRHTQWKYIIKFIIYIHLEI